MVLHAPGLAGTPTTLCALLSLAETHKPCLHPAGLWMLECCFLGSQLRLWDFPQETGSLSSARLQPSSTEAMGNLAQG